jgi:putative endonuclease
MAGLFGFLGGRKDNRTGRRKTGDAGEDAAARLLRQSGYRVVARNVSYPAGEVDLVVREKATGRLCFVEVRSRTVDPARPPAVTPEQSVTAAKRRRVVAAARRFLAEGRIRAAGPIRFDVVTVRFGPDGGEPDVRHYPGAFDGRGRLV